MTRLHDIDAQPVGEDGLERFIEHLVPMMPTDSPLAPHSVAQPAFDKISSTLHLAWIRQVLRPKAAKQFSLTIHVQEAFCSALICKSNIWTIREGIRILCNENPIIATASGDRRQGELDHYTQMAQRAVRMERLRGKADDHGDFLVLPTDLLAWAQGNGVPVDGVVAQSINDKKIGAIAPRPRNRSPGRPVDPKTEQNYQRWQTEAEKLKRANPRLSKADIARQISRKPIAEGKDEQTIRKKLRI